MPSRKRGRNEEEEDQSVPISKRINRLQLGQSTGDFQQPLHNMMGETSQAHINQVHMGNGVGNGVANGMANGMGEIQGSIHGAAGGIENPALQDHQQGLYSPQHPIHAPEQQSPPHRHTSPVNHMFPSHSSPTNSFLTTPMLSDPLLPNLEPYDPELTAAENPNYYDVNRLLYEAHVERLRRNPFGGGGGGGNP